MGCRSTGAAVGTIFLSCVVLAAQSASPMDTVTVLPDGRGLPAGQGTAEAGRLVYARSCESCHGPEGRGGSAPALAGGAGSLASPRPLQTVGSFWPYATTLWDYINRAMPPERPGSLTTDDVYAATAYILRFNGIIRDGDVMTATTLPRVAMPNRDGFVPDPRGAERR